MEHLDLKIFEEVARTCSVSKAAQNLGYVQTNVTAHIKKLESELNAALFIRHNKGVSLTSEGEKLRLRSTEILALMDDTVAQFRHASKTIRVGTTPTIAGYLLPKCIMEYQKQFHQTDFSVVTQNQTEMGEMLNRRDLDFIITNQNRFFEHAQQVLQIQESMVLIAPTVAQNIADIWDYPLVVNSLVYCPYKDSMLGWWYLHQTKVPQVVEIDNTAAIINFVTMGGGIAIIPEKVKTGPSVRRFYLDDLPPHYIRMWIPRGKFTSEYGVFKRIAEAELEKNF